MTSPARTLMDVAVVLQRRQLERALDAAERLDLVAQQQLEAITARHPGHLGAARLSATLAEHRIGSTFTRSELEERFLVICRDHRLILPEVNARVDRYEVDFLWPASRVIVETDGFSTHGTRDAFERDRDRDARLTVLGYLVLRFSYRRIAREPRVVASLVRRALRSRPGDHRLPLPHGDP